MDTEDDGIRALLTDYALKLDADDIDGCLALFTHDGEFTVYGKTFSGRDSIRRMFESAPRGLHLTGGCAITFAAEQTATARSQVLFVNATTHELRPALYDDKLTRIDGRWRFCSRRCRFLAPDGLSDRPQ